MGHVQVHDYARKVYVFIQFEIQYSFLWMFKPYSCGIESIMAASKSDFIRTKNAQISDYGRKEFLILIKMVVFKKMLVFNGQNNKILIFNSS